MKVTACKISAFLLLSLLFIADSQSFGQAVPINFDKVQVKSKKITDNFYTLVAEGDTMQPTAVGLLLGPDGIFMVDDEYTPLSDKLMAAIRQISDAPIRYVVNTHIHADHVGGNEEMGKSGATIIARDEVRDRLIHPRIAANGKVPDPAPAIALPKITFEGRTTFHVNGETIELIPIPPAHTDGDTLVYFHNADIIMSGDYYRSIQYPNIDHVQGGTLNGLLDGMAILVGIAGPNTKIIPGHGPIVGRADAMAHRDMILGVRDRVAQLIAQGKTEQEVVAAHPTADYDARVLKSDQRREGFVMQVYEELNPKK